MDTQESYRSRKKNRSNSYEKRKGPFIADSHTWDLKYGRKTPMIEARDHIARYGSGFSKLLQIAATTNQDRTMNESRLSATTPMYDDSIMAPGDEED